MALYLTRLSALVKKVNVIDIGHIVVIKSVGYKQGIN